MKVARVHRPCGALALAVAVLQSACSLLFSPHSEAQDTSGQGPGADATSADARSLGIDDGGGGLDSDAQASDAGSTLLIDRGLTARYFIEESASGSAVLALVDSAPDPLALELSYSSGPSFFEVSTGRGLSWPAVDGDGLALVSVAGSKLDNLANSRTGTIEVVLAVSGSGPLSTPSALVHLGKTNFRGGFSLWVGDDNLVMLGFGDVIEGTWQVPTLNQRTVLHLVVDTLEPAASRARLFANGVEVGPSSGPSLASDTGIFIGGGANFVVGNDGGGGRSPSGSIDYIAVYGSALTASEVAGNSAILGLSGDTP